MTRPKRWPKGSLDYPKPLDPARESKLALRNRHIRREKMLTFRSVPVKRRIWWVTLTATEVSEYDFKPRELPAGLTFTPQAFWCISRRKAARLIELDRQSGGSGALYPVEFRL